MALISPGVQVTVIDQSQYIPAATNSVPYILLATAQNKISGSGIGVAAGTLASNANKTYLISSQRDLLATFGNPFFYTTTTGVPINGYELNEYGLLAAYSSLGVSNRCYVQRVDIDLAELTASLIRPTGSPNNGTYWFDTNDSSWGLFEWNQTTSTFTNKIPEFLVNTTDLIPSSTVPLDSYGSIGDYAVTANTSVNVQNPTYYKRGGPTSSQTSSSELSDLYNTWVLVGSDEWKTANPTVVSTTYNPTLTAGNTVAINGVTVSVPAGPANTVVGLSDAINSAAIPGVYSAYAGNTLQLYANSEAGSPSLAITGSSSNVSAGTLTFTYGSQVSAPFSANLLIRVSGANTDSYNNYYTVTSCTTTSVTVSGYNEESWTSGGTPRVFYNNNGIGEIGISGTALASLGITAATYNAPTYFDAASFNSPRWNSSGPTPEPTGSVYQKINNVNQGAQLVVKKYNSTLGTFVQQTCTVVPTVAIATHSLDETGGGKNIPAGSTIALIDTLENKTATLVLLERYATGPTIITAQASSLPVTFVSGNKFLISATQPQTQFVTTPVVAELTGTTAADFIAAVSAAAVPNVSAVVNSAGQIVFTHAAGGEIYLQDIVGTPVATAGFSTACRGITVKYQYGDAVGLTLSNWVTAPTFAYTASNVAPDQDPAAGRLWYYSETAAADIMIQATVAGIPGWYGYQNVTNDVRGYDLSQTDPNGPLISSSVPTVDSQGNPLAYGQLWIDTSDLENYPLISRWELVNGQDQWVRLDNADQTTSDGILFADARWASNGSTNPISDALPTIAPGGLITSNYLDPDAPSFSLFPQGMLLWNTRRSGFNVKRFEPNYFNQTTFPAYDWDSSALYRPGNLVSYSGVVYNAIATGSNNLPTNTAYWTPLEQTNTWLTATSNLISQATTVVAATGATSAGVGYFGRRAQRELIVEAMKAGIDSSVGAREEAAAFNLIATPGYPELIPNMALLNNDRNNTAFVIGDTPLRLTPADVVTWQSNNNGLGLLTNDGLTTYDPYIGVFYPSCQTTDLTGNQVATYPSHMMVRTIIRSDEVSYPWFAPAGTQRGVVDNATQLGYVNGQTGAFTTIGVNQGLRDTLYQASINPITFIPGVGITNFGNKTTTTLTSALDRINVARLVAFIRSRLESIGKQYLFEPNDQITRDSIRNAINSLMIDLVAKRGIYDYLVVCDLTNNTPFRIDNNELWVDIAIEPVKAVEFVYIPLRIQNTGSIAAAATA